jgi:aryl-alcohol dehydrogenase-like predicted oxidoreductase
VTPLPAAGVARLVLGGRFGLRPQRVSDQLVEAFGAAGGRWVETAHSYAAGAAEPSVAAAVARSPDRLGVVTKVGHPDARGRSTLRRTELAAQIATSSRRLGEVPIALVMLHRDDPAQPAEALLQPLAQAQREGLVTGIGVANWRCTRAEEAREALGGDLAAVSLQHAVVRPRRPPWPGTRHADQDDLRWALRHRVCVLAWSPLAGGYVVDPRNCLPQAFATYDSTPSRQKTTECASVAHALGLPAAAVALAALMQNPMVLPVIGPESPVELAAALAGANLAADRSAQPLLAKLVA